MMNGMENHTKEQAEGYVEDKKEDARLFCSLHVP